MYKKYVKIIKKALNEIMLSSINIFKFHNLWYLLPILTYCILSFDTANPFIFDFIRMHII